MDEADQAAAYQEKLNEHAVRRPPMLPPSLICGKCGERNDRPAFFCCSDCVEGPCE